MLLALLLLLRERSDEARCWGANVDNDDVDDDGAGMRLQVSDRAVRTGVLVT